MSNKDDTRVPLRILGVDPGSVHTGYGLLEGQGGRWRAVCHGRVTARQSQPLAERLVTLTAGLEEVLQRWNPEVAVLERSFHGASSRSLIVLAQARGALLLTLARRGLTIAEYSPAEVKAAVAGSGVADKSQVARMVNMQLRLAGERLSSDASDALAVALCYALRFRADRTRAGNPSVNR